MHAADGEGPVSRLDGRFERFQLECWLAQDRLRAAVTWADGMRRGEAREGQPVSEDGASWPWPAC